MTIEEKQNQSSAKTQIAQILESLEAAVSEKDLHDHLKYAAKTMDNFPSVFGIGFLSDVSHRLARIASGNDHPLAKLGIAAFTIALAKRVEQSEACYQVMRAHTMHLLHIANTADEANHRWTAVTTITDLHERLGRVMLPATLKANLEAVKYLAKREKDEVVRGAFKELQATLESVIESANGQLTKS